MTDVGKMYGGALFELCAEEARDEAVRDQLRQVTALMRENPDYEKLLCTPNIPKAERRADGYERGYGSYGAGRGSGYNGYNGNRGNYGNYGSGAGGYGSGAGGYGARTPYGYKSSRGSGFSGTDEGAFRTFGTGSTAKLARPAPSPSSAPVRYGNAGMGAPQQPRKDTSGFAVGVRVRHARFGEGVVTAMRGAGTNVIITVSFEKAGNKDLAAALAPLEIL